MKYLEFKQKTVTETFQIENQSKLFTCQFI